MEKIHKNRELENEFKNINRCLEQILSSDKIGEGNLADSTESFLTSLKKISNITGKSEQKLFKELNIPYNKQSIKFKGPINRIKKKILDICKKRRDTTDPKIQVLDIQRSANSLIEDQINKLITDFSTDYRVSLEGDGLVDFIKNIFLEMLNDSSLHKEQFLKLLSDPYNIEIITIILKNLFEEKNISQPELKAKDIILQIKINQSKPSKFSLKSFLQKIRNSNKQKEDIKPLTDLENS